MTLDYYRIFYYVAKYKSFSKAAQILHNNEYIKIDRDKSTFKSHRDFDSEIGMTFKHF